MARITRGAFLAIAVVFHLIYIYSIFDIYFVSPIVTGMKAYGVDWKELGKTAPAKRVVLFVGDGLRADKAFQSFPDPSSSDPSSPDALVPRPLAPYLRSRVLEHGTFGVSHTRVPTESRPGHVALIAGLYEDVSAVTTGWKLNPVNFDSVFNRSRHTWSWGSPDILPMFVQGAVPGRVDGDTYGHEAEDFTADALELDVWVFDKVKEMFANAKTNATLDAELRQEKNVFFLHLLGLDTNGHAYRPYSKEYLNNIKVVDQGVKEITELIDDFYGDGKTAFVFTADHGMSDWGSHGDGHPDNTRTPLIVWGSGVAKPLKAEGVALGHEDGFSSDWGLDQVQRHDVAQADIAALMAYLGGIDFPVNSVGELPLEYIDADERSKAEAMLVNAQGVMEMYRVKEEQKSAQLLRYKPYPGLGDEEHSVDHRIASIRNAIDSDDFASAIQQSRDMIAAGLAGMRYLQTYDWLFLRVLITLGYFGWIAFAITTMIDLHVLGGKTATNRTMPSTIAFSSALVAIYSLLLFQRSSWRYYFYAIFPVGFWEEVFARRGALIKGKEVLLGHLASSQDYISFAAKTLAFIAVLEGLVQSYFHREIYTVCYLLAIAWPAFYGKRFLTDNKVLVATWALACGSMSLFTLLPANKVENLNLVLLGGYLMFIVGAFYVIFEKNLLADSRSRSQPAQGKDDSLARSILGAQVGLIVLAIFVTKSSSESIQAKTGLPLGTQVVGWITLLASLAVPFLHGLRPNSHYIHRLAVLFLAFAPSFIILTISYEGLFYLAFSLTVFTWVRMEHHIHLLTHAATTKPQQSSKSSSPSPSKTNQTTPYRPLTLADFRTSLFFLYLLQSAFFSTGNIASISSFSLDAVYRLIPIFDPFSQGALLMYKILIPFALISANLGILNKRLGVAPSALFMGVVAAADWLTVRFFWMVRDEGSWLEIGTSISRFCIVSALGVFVAGLEGGSGVLVRGVGFEGDGGDGKGDESGSGKEDGVDGSRNGNGNGNSTLSKGTDTVRRANGSGKTAKNQ
ncbi:PigN-domain-containing protein [Pseudovirgaria hyperparasitica]|uniref:GPI ethanolamine phosphate transferase 1 n=1 Tax=Pseudovirgaria hyperparasitica TaxID=470096 RepID=A0A6A6WLM3_9PEZI|nr:PigN-domain-containing protein [Pseudovirgaria hyperparasitica]KAF2763063.1 PigN-domain-containing protein [Pseudovirgaria hyperparasitica]